MCRACPVPAQSAHSSQGASGGSHPSTYERPVRLAGVKAKPTLEAGHHGDGLGQLADGYITTGAYVDMAEQWRGFASVSNRVQTHHKQRRLMSQPEQHP